VTVGAALATALHTPDPDGLRMKVRNTGANAVDIGGSDVTTGAGFSLAAGAEEEFDVASGDVLYAVSAGGQSNVLQVLRLGQWTG
jgi:hypothetical protein